MATSPRHTLDAYATRIQDCKTPQQLFAIFDQEMKSEGYQNVVFARVYGQPDRLEVPYGNVPEGDARLYFQERLWEHDPILATSQTSVLPFAWIDVMMRKSLSDAARRVMELSAAIGVQGGLTIPFHRPGGHWDLISLSMRDKSRLDAARIHIVNLKSYATVQRYLELEAATDTASDTITSEQQFDARGRHHQAASEAHCCDGCGHDHPQHGDGVGVIDDEECRALVLADIAWKRYSAGLLALNSRLPAIIGDRALDTFVARGLIEEEADDFRFSYVFKPSPVGKSHLKACPQVTSWRDEVWTNYVEAHERPVD